MTPKSLGKLVKAHLHKTLTELIRERILREAKWEMLHTTKPVKQVARELGFEDVFYFSRLLCPFREPQAGQSLRRSTRSSRTSTSKQNRMDRAVSGSWGMADIDSMVI
jgi:AraC-like DNA-binding protein